MGIGRVLRRLSGPLEPWLTRVYRDVFFDVDDLAQRVAGLAARRADAGEPVRRVVEIGCGEGAQLAALSRRLPDAAFTGIDISPAVGRLFDGDAARARFECIDAAALARREPASADLVLICDVMHHIPAAVQASVWHAAAALVAPGGRIVFKDWLRQPTPIYWLGWASDRFITGDRIAYQAREAWLDDLRSALPAWTVEAEMSLKPWRTNHAFVLRRAG